MRDDPPPAEAIEVSIFSRGHGEALAIHVGNGRWIFVDSLLTQGERPVLTSYLEGCGIDAGSAVDVVLFTHWHADHVAGALQVVQICKEALVALPGVLLDPEFRALLPEMERSRGHLTGPTQEFTGLMRLLVQERRDLTFCSAGMDMRATGGRATYTFDALSPSGGEQTRMVRDLRAWLVQGRRLRDRPDRNATSVASVLATAGETLLLGADLEVGPRSSGWQAVHEKAWRGRDRATLFKVPHHGSVTAHHAPVWESMLVADVLAVLAPWGLGSKLPTGADVMRIMGLTPNAYAAARPGRGGGRRRAAAVGAELRSLGYPLQRMSGEVGQVRLRKMPGAAWKVDLSGGACKLADLV